MKAAVDSYFGIDISKIDPAQAAIIAGLPKSPSNYDLVRNAIEKCTTDRRGGRGLPQVAARSSRRTTTVVQRRNQILELLAAAAGPRCPATSTRSAQFKAAEDEPVVLVEPDHPELDRAALRLGGPRRARRQAVRSGRRYLRRDRARRAAGHHDPRRRPPEDRREVGQGRRDRPAHEEPDGGRQGARVQEARTVDGQPQEQGPPQRGAGRARLPDRRARRLRRQRRLLRDVDKPEFQPQYDVVGKGYRQPGSAFKPINYVTGINAKKITAGTMLMDVGTDFGGLHPE